MYSPDIESKLQLTASASKQIRQIPKNLNFDEVKVNGQASLVLSSDLENLLVCLVKQLHKFFDEICNLCINELEHRFTEALLDSVIAANK